MAKEKNSVILWHSFLDVMLALTHDELKEVLRAFKSYIKDESISFTQRGAEIAWKGISLQLDADKKKWESACDKRAEAGRIGMAKRWSNSDNKTNAADITNITNDNKNNKCYSGVTNITNDNKNNSNSNSNIYKEKIYKKESCTPSVVEQPKPKPQAKRFVPPTLEEVKAYAAEKQYAGFNADTFVAHYTANGWRVGRNPMRDWRAAVRYWTSNNNSNNNTGYNNYGNANNRTNRNEGTFNELSDYSKFDE